MGILKDMKKLYPDIMRQRDKFRKVPLQNYLRLADLEINNDSQSRLKFLRQFYAFVFTSGIIQDIGIQWVQQSLTVKELKSQIEENIMEKDRRTYRWYNGKLAYDNKKIREYFKDESMIEKVQRYQPDHVSKGYDLSKYEDELKNAQLKLQPKTDMLKDCVIDLRQQNYCKQISDAEFDAAIKIMSIYSNNTIKAIQESIPSNIKGYINYIQNIKSQNLSTDDTRRYDRIVKAINEIDNNSLLSYSRILKEAIKAIENNTDIDINTFKV